MDNLNQLTYFQVHRFSWQFVFWALLVIFFISINILCNSRRISVWLLFYNFYLFIDILYLLRCYFHTFLFSLEINFLRSLNIVVTADSKLWYNKSNILLGTSTITVNFFFFLCMAHLFLLLCTPCNFFLLKTGPLNIAWQLWKSDSCS